MAGTERAPALRLVKGQPHIETSHAQRVEALSWAVRQLHPSHLFVRRHRLALLDLVLISAEQEAS